MGRRKRCVNSKSYQPWGQLLSSNALPHSIRHLQRFLFWQFFLQLIPSFRNDTHFCLFFFNKISFIKNPIFFSVSDIFIARMKFNVQKHAQKHNEQINKKTVNRKKFSPHFAAIFRIHRRTSLTFPDFGKRLKISESLVDPDLVWRMSVHSHLILSR